MTHLLTQQGLHPRLVWACLLRFLQRGALATGPLMGDLHGAAGFSPSAVTLACHMLLGVALGAKRHNHSAKRLRAAFVLAMQALENVSSVSVLGAIAALAGVAFIAEFILAARGVVLDAQ